MTKEEMEHFFALHQEMPLATIGGTGCTLMESLYQALKTRLMHECSVVERMTTEEFEEWKKKMVLK